MSSEPREYLRHILVEAEYLLTHSRDLSFDAFRNDETLCRAFVRSLEIIGEATKKIPAEFRAGYTDVDWRSMASMRDRLIHDYVGVDYDIVWDVVSNHIPPLRARVQSILAD
jgi:uncharacterized protein with HEPN domain